MSRAVLAVLAAAAASLLLVAACGRAPAPDAPASYRAADGSFTARLPGNWRVDESPGETRKAALFGPPGGEHPYSQLMGVYFHAEAGEAAAAAERYLASLQDGGAPPRRVTAGGAPALEARGSKTVADPHLGQRRLATRVVAVPAAGGFWTLEQTWPEDAAPDPAFEELVSSFKPAR